MMARIAAVKTLAGFDFQPFLDSDRILAARAASLPTSQLASPSCAVPEDSERLTRLSVMVSIPTKRQLERLAKQRDKSEMRRRARLVSLRLRNSQGERKGAGLVEQPTPKPRRDRQSALQILARAHQKASISRRSIDGLARLTLALRLSGCRIPRILELVALPLRAVV